MKLLFFVSVSLLLLFISCQKELEIDYPEIEQRLVVNCFFTPDSLFEVRVGKLLSVNDNSTAFIVDDADCEIWENGIFAESLHYTNTGFYISESLVPKVGSVYSIKINHLDYPSITATDTVPEPVEISEVYFVHNTLYDPLDESYFHDFNIRFQDKAKEHNYYELKLLLEIDYEESENEIRTLLLTKTNSLALLNTGLIELEPASIPFNDELFNGDNYFLSTYYTLPFYRGNGDGNVYYDTHNLIVHFNAVSYQYYQYTRKMIMHLRNQESDIFEGIGDPVQMYSNIENGYGIFAAYNPHVDTLHHELSW